jgi:hypothetical protein
MTKEFEFLDYVRINVTVRYARFASATPAQAAQWAMDAMEDAYKVVERIPEAHSAHHAAMQFAELMFIELRPKGWECPRWLLTD